MYELVKIAGRGERGFEEEVYVLPPDCLLHGTTRRAHYCCTWSDMWVGSWMLGSGSWTLVSDVCFSGAAPDAGTLKPVPEPILGGYFGRWKR